MAFTFDSTPSFVLSKHPDIWRYMLVLASLPAVFLWFGMLIVPESPRWLESKGKFGDALRVLQQVREEKRNKAELSEIRAAINHESKMNRATFKDLSVPCGT